ncbi:tyrosine-type recombinase/integrase [Bacillus bombysepticus]
MTSSAAYQTKIVSEKKEEMLKRLHGYWMNDKWDVTDSFFETYGGGDSWSGEKKRIDFTPFSLAIRQELKYFCVIQLINGVLTLKTLVFYSSTFTYLSALLNKYYPEICSFIEIPYEKGLMKYKIFLTNVGVKIKTSEGYNSLYIRAFTRVYKFFFDLYDTRMEFEKDVWDVRKIPNARYSKHHSAYLLRFDRVHTVYRATVKTYFRYAITYLSQSELNIKLKGIRYFTEFLQRNHTDWNDLTTLQRSHIEAYLIYFNQSFGHFSVGRKGKYLYSVKTFIEYLQRSEHSESPTTPISALFFKEDFPKPRRQNENGIKYIPDTVMSQLEIILSQNSDRLKPPMKENDKEYVPIVILLMATGWRISDILNLRYHNCLITNSNGEYYLQGDIPKTNVKNHRVPIDQDVATIIQTMIKQTVGKSTTENNPEKYLFVRTKGQRNGKPFIAKTVQDALNRWAKRYNIVDQYGNIYHFENHAFRHTKGVELINLGMNLTHIMKWFAHSSPEMTLIYAKIADDTLRKEWEKAQEKKGPLLRINLDNGQVNEMEMDEDLIHWEYIRSNVEAVRVPLGFCLASKKEGCPYVVTPCLTCPNFCTTPDNLLDFEKEIQRVEEHIQMTQSYPIYNEKTKEQLDNLIKIRDQLAGGNSHRGDSAKKILFDAQLTKEKGASQ